MTANPLTLNSPKQNFFSLVANNFLKYTTLHVIPVTLLATCTALFVMNISLSD